MEYPQYDPSIDPFYGMETLGTSVGLIGGATLLIDPADVDTVHERLPEQLCLL